MLFSVKNNVVFLRNRPRN